jgi:hypothetical protein
MMVMHFDDKGKFFTEYVSKRAVEAIIQTTTNRIHGFIYIRPNERVSDELNRTEQFLAITDAEVFSFQGDKEYSCEFLSVNREMIVWLMPQETAEVENQEE